MKSKIVGLIIFMWLISRAGFASPDFLTGSAVRGDVSNLSFNDNFAVVAGQPNFSFGTLYFNLFGMGINYNELSFSGYLDKKSSYGGIYGSRRYSEESNLENEKFSISENMLRMFYSRKLWDIKIGGALDFFQNNLSLDGTQQGRGYSPALSLAVAYNYNRMRLGVLAERLIGNTVYYADNNRGKLPTRISVGIGMLIKNFDISAGYGSGLFISALYKYKILSAAANAEYSSATKLLTLAGGIGISLKNYDIRYGLSYNNGGLTHYFGGDYKFWYRAKNISVDASGISSIFAAQYNGLAKTGIGQIYIQNKSDSVMFVNISYRIKGLSNKWMQENTIIRPHLKKEVAIYPAVGDKVVLLKKQKKYRLEYTLKYQTDKNYRYKDSKEITVYPVNYYAGDLYDELGAYITFKDKRIQSLISSIIKAHDKIRNRIFVENKLQNAMLFYYYISSLSLQNMGNDVILLPVQTFTSKQGTLIDLAVSYAALLEAAGIKTKILFVKNDIVILLDSGVPATERGSFGALQDNVFVDEGKCYIPISIKSKGATFIENWTAAYNSLYTSPPYIVVDVENALKTFPPVNSELLSADMPIDYNILKSELLKETQGLENERLTYYEKGYFSILKEEPDNAEVYNQLGILYSKNLKFDKAIKHFNKAIELKPGYSGVHNNLANVYTEQKQYSLAEKQYEKAIKIAPADARYYRNLGKLYELRKDLVKAKENYYKAAELNLEKYGYLKKRIK